MVYLHVEMQDKSLHNHTLPATLVTHSENFHTDDVFGTALLRSLFPNAEILRSRDPEVITGADIVYDVGKVYDPSAGRYDHHQIDAGLRSNGIKYSAFGLLWQQYGTAYCDGDTEVAAAIEKQLVTPIDAFDNGQTITDSRYNDVDLFTIDDIISTFNKLEWTNENERDDEQFWKAVDLASLVLSRLRASISNKITSQRALLDAYNKTDDKSVLTMEKRASVNGIVNQCPDLLYIVSPRSDGIWGVLAVSAKPGGFTPRKPFPAAWAGQSADTLRELTGVSDVTFCHVNRFYVAARSKEGAEALSRIAVTTVE
jgi:uncharacterized UPF0160 family protein